MHGDLVAAMLTARAKEGNTDPNMLFLNFKCLVAAFIGTEARVVILPGWAQTINCWGILVAGSGQGKSVGMRYMTEWWKTLWRW
jgi:hypothetical protein